MGFLSSQLLEFSLSSLFCGKGSLSDVLSISSQPESFGGPSQNLGKEPNMIYTLHSSSWKQDQHFETNFSPSQGVGTVSEQIHTFFFPFRKGAKLIWPLVCLRNFTVFSKDGGSKKNDELLLYAVSEVDRGDQNHSIPFTRLSVYNISTLNTAFLFSPT